MKSAIAALRPAGVHAAAGLQLAAQHDLAAARVHHGELACVGGFHHGQLARAWPEAELAYADTARRCGIHRLRRVAGGCGKCHQRLQCDDDTEWRSAIHVPVAPFDCNVTCVPARGRERHSGGGAFMTGQIRPVLRSSRWAGFILVALCALPGVAAAQWINYRTPGIPRNAEGTPNLKAPCRARRKASRISRHVVRQCAVEGLLQDRRLHPGRAHGARAGQHRQQAQGRSALHGMVEGNR